MKKGIWFAVLAVPVAVATFAGITRAGWKSSGTLALSSTDADIQIGGLRNTTDSTQYAGCSVSSSGSAPMAFCLFRDMTKAKGCSTSDPELVSVISTLHGDSGMYVQFNSSGVCTYVDVSAGSYQAPRRPGLPDAAARRLDQRGQHRPDRRRARGALRRPTAHRRRERRERHPASAGAAISTT